MNLFKLSSKVCRSTLALLLLAATVSCQGSGEPKLDKYGGLTSIKGEATGFFHVEKINDRFWFVNPLGNVFFPIGLSHLYSGETDEACQNIYNGDKQLWLEDSFEKAKALGFNCALGSATSPERNLNGFVDMDAAEAIFRENNFPYAVGVILLKHPWEFVEGEDLPDIYTDEYHELIESRAKENCLKYKDDPLVLGYYYGFGAFNRSSQWVNQYLSFPAGAPGREALVDVLAERYEGNVKLFNERYDMKLKSIDDLRSKTTLAYSKIFEDRNYPNTKDLIDVHKLDDFEAIISAMCVKLYKMGHDAIRKYDQNHLIMGSFVKEFSLSPEAWKVSAPYIDMIAPQHINKDIDLHKSAQAANLPIIVSDDYAGWFYHATNNNHGHAGVASHEARGLIYEANLMRHYKDPYVMGVTHCACMFDQSGSTTGIVDKQTGIYDKFTGEPHSLDLLNSISSINHAVYTEAVNPVPMDDLDQLDQYDNVLWEAWEQYATGLPLWDLEKMKMRKKY